jgi:hypothetical protein
MKKSGFIKKLQWRLIATVFIVVEYRDIYAYPDTMQKDITVKTGSKVETTESNELDEYKDQQTGLTCKEIGEYAKWAMKVWQYDAPMIDFLMSRTQSQKKVAMLALEYSSTFPKDVDKWHKNHYVNKVEVDFSVWCKSGFLWELPEKLKSR